MPRDTGERATFTRRTYHRPISVEPLTSVHPARTAARSALPDFSGAPGAKERELLFLRVRTRDYAALGRRPKRTRRSVVTASARTKAPSQPGRALAGRTRQAQLLVSSFGRASPPPASFAWALPAVPVAPPCVAPPAFVTAPLPPPGLAPPLVLGAPPALEPPLGVNFAREARGQAAIPATGHVLVRSFARDALEVLAALSRCLAHSLAPTAKEVRGDGFTPRGARHGRSRLAGEVRRTRRGAGDVRLDVLPFYTLEVTLGTRSSRRTAPRGPAAALAPARDIPAGCGTS